MLVQNVLPKQAGSLNLISVTSYCPVWLVKQAPRVPEDIFFLMDTDGSRQSHVNEAQSAERKKYPLVTGVTSLISMQF